MGHPLSTPSRDAAPRRGPASATRVLIVEDDASARAGLTELIRSWGYETDGAADGQDALDRFGAFQPTVVLTDLVMPRLDGLALLKTLREHEEDTTVLILTAQGTVETAVEAIRIGAYDYLTKPVDPQRLKIVLSQVVERQERRREVKALRRQLREQGCFGPMVGRSAAMRQIYALVEQAAPTAASVLIVGESGTGKELVAQTIHQLSPRAAFPYVPINCAAIPDTLLESELFGHEKGAFTGAGERRAGCFELADRGTLFLDEIAEMSPATQAKLLRVLQERRFRRVGGRQEQDVDARIIAATNADPAEAVKNGKLREDLYYRLNVFTLTLPPLRDRREDVPLLEQAFLKEFNERYQKSLAGVDPQVAKIFESYAWPGNVRELHNAMERAAIVATGEFIEVRHLPAAVVEAGRLEPTRRTLSLEPGTTVEEAERQLIQLTLEHTGDNKTRTAEILGISLKTLHNKLNKLKLRGE